MIRQTFIQHLDHDPEFEWRGKDVTRLENLSDIVFAIAFGTIASAASTPRTFPDLNDYLLGAPPLIVAFIVLAQVWNQHFVFFRRYGFADRRIIFLNGLILLTVLFIAYPLRFIFESLFA